MGDAGWVAVASLFVTTLFAWLNKRDSLRHDADNRDLKNQNTIQAMQIATQAAQIATLTSNTKACEEKHEEKDAKLKKCEEKHETMEVQIAEIKGQIAQIKKEPPP